MTVIEYTHVAVLRMLLYFVCAVLIVPGVSYCVYVLPLLFLCFVYVCLRLWFIVAVFVLCCFVCLM